MRKISSIVIAIHFAVILWMICFGMQAKSVKKTKLVVKTVSPSKGHVVQPRSAPAPTPVAAAVQNTPQISVAPKPTPVAVAAPKKGVQPTSPKKPPQVKAPSESRPSAATVELIKQLEKSLAKIEQAKPTPALSSVKRSTISVPTLKIDHLLETGDAGYEDELIAVLHNQLHLPEFGEVKMKLTLQNNGAFVKMQVIRAQSAKNRLYLEEQLPKLHMPRFIGMLNNKKEETFVITFCNE